MREYHRRVEEAGSSFAVAERRLLDEVNWEVGGIGGLDAAYEEKGYHTAHVEARSDLSDGIWEKEQAGVEGLEDWTVKDSSL